MNDELEELSDATLNEVFAVEVAGFERHNMHRFATSADAVMPYLEKVRWKAQHYPPDGVWIDVDAPAFGDAYAPTFARAACIALIRAKRVSD